MTQSWPSTPHFKIEVGSETIEDCEGVSIVVVRPENNVSYAVIKINDYQSRNFVDIFDAFDTVDISFKYGADSYTQVFSGMVQTVAPRLDASEGEILEVSAWGWAWALAKTHCNTSYGVESERPTLTHPQEIIQDLITDFINKSFDDTNTQWGIGTGKVENVHAAFDVTHLACPYIDNFTVLNRLCDLTNAYAVGAASVSIHWMMDTSKNLYVKLINADSSDGAWDRYWGGMSGTNPGTQASSTITVSDDMIVYDFRKNIEEYANNVVLCSDLRKPAYDYVTEDAVANSLWATAQCNETDSATCIVGSNSYLIEPNVGVPPAATADYPAAQNAAWDFTKCGSINTIPRLNFYMRINAAARASGITLIAYTDAANASYVSNIESYVAANDEFYHLSFPLGPYYNTTDETRRIRWAVGLGAGVTWSDVDYIGFMVGNNVAADVYVDDFHFTGKVIREADDSSEITATKKEHQRVFRVDTAMDDTLKASDDSGTAARLAYAELLRRSQTPIVGMITIPGAPTLLPGQTIYVEACKERDGTYRIQKDMRVKELRHAYTARGFTTTLNLTDDVTNTHAFAVPSAFDLVKEYAGALQHAEAKDLKSSGIDFLIPKLSKSY